MDGHGPGREGDAGGALAAEDELGTAATSSARGSSIGTGGGEAVQLLQDAHCGTADGWQSRRRRQRLAIAVLAVAVVPSHATPLAAASTSTGSATSATSATSTSMVGRRLGMGLELTIGAGVSGVGRNRTGRRSRRGLAAAGGAAGPIPGPGPLLGLRPDRHGAGAAAGGQHHLDGQAMRRRPVLLEGFVRKVVRSHQRLPQAPAGLVGNCRPRRRRRRRCRCRCRCTPSPTAAAPRGEG